jgi:periplasmic divalent cation tolerance protein
MTDFVIVLTTVPAGFDARTLAADLVSARVTACVSILPGVESVYAWQGAVHHDAEVQLANKTTRARVADVWTALRARHPYDTPEFLVLPVLEGEPSYLQWISDSTRATDRP